MSHTQIAPSSVAESDLLSSTATLLLPEAALASRVLRQCSLPFSLLKWLAAPEKPCVTAEELSAAPSIVESLNELVRPLLVGATDWEIQQAEKAAERLAAIYKRISDRHASLGLGTGERLIAASLLPLYRSLATGDLNQGLEQTRHRLFETIVIGELCAEFGVELTEVIDYSIAKEVSPYESAFDALQISVTGIGNVLRRSIRGFDPETGNFTAEMSDRLFGIEAEDIDTIDAAIAEWAKPDLLWRLSGEMIAKKSNIVLPRSWCDAAVPWHSISDHWNKLSHLLKSSSSKASRAGMVEDAHEPCEDPTIAPASISQAKRDAAAAGGHHSADDLEMDEASTIAEDASTHSAESKFIPPKILIAEIMSHNDPVYVNVIKRELATCRNESRAVTVASVVVVADDPKRKEFHGSARGGIRPWQQRLVNNLADHPDIEQPSAFITSDGELLLCILDLDRSEVTRILREGLDEVIGGISSQPTGDDLVKHTPSARYFCGIASTDSPTAGMTPEQMIEATCRCLKAANAQGKSTIKSIEVY